MCFINCDNDLLIVFILRKHLFRFEYIVRVFFALLAGGLHLETKMPPSIKQGGIDIC